MAQNDYKDELMKYKIILLSITILAMVANIYFVKSSFDEAEQEREEIFIADSQNTLLLALSNDINTNRGNEAKAVVGKMHTHLFYMTPTSSAIEGGIKKACDLSDASVKQYCDKVRESGWYNKMMAEGISMEFMQDSIVLYECDVPGYDYMLKTYGKTCTITSTIIEFKRIETTCYVQEQGRTIENPNGYKCCNFAVNKLERLRIFERQNEENKMEE
ncbi:MAG: hypothetical protein MJZ11_10570 [Lachnospiraceae bacterium]|nr:hypothetical protein [Lachnospiraceae bacterium]